MQTSDDDKEIARGLREHLREKRISPKDIARRLPYSESRVLRQIRGQEHFPRPTMEKWYIALDLEDGKTGTSPWEQEKGFWQRLDGLSDEELASHLRRDLPDTYRY